jgi:hypothetical protein
MMWMYFELIKDATTGTHEQATAAMHRGFQRTRIVQRGV